MRSHATCGVCRSVIIAASLAALASAAHAQPITPAPAFNAERLSTLPRDEWITNGGTIANQRYSPLDLINRGNVAGLKGLWRTGLESGTGPGNSAQAGAGKLASPRGSMAGRMTNGRNSVNGS